MSGFTINYRAPGHPVPDTLYFPELDDHIINQIRRTASFYEEALLEYLYYAVPHGGIFLDVGANIGNHTLFFSRYMADRVLAIEPQPETFSVLQWTVSKNMLENVACLSYAVSSEKGIGVLSLPDGFEKNIGCFTLLPCDKSTRNVEVPVKTLDSLFVDTLAGSEMPVRLIKIDVEGYEHRVLKGARELLNCHHPDIVVEAKNDRVLKDIRQTLSPLGYRVLGRFNATPTYHLSCRSYLRCAACRLNRKVGGFFRKVISLAK